MQQSNHSKIVLQRSISIYYFFCRNKIFNIEFALCRRIFSQIQNIKIHVFFQLATLNWCHHSLSIEIWKSLQTRSIENPNLQWRTRQITFQLFLIWLVQKQYNIFLNILFYKIIYNLTVLYANFCFSSAPWSRRDASINWTSRIVKIKRNFFSSFLVVFKYTKLFMRKKDGTMSILYIIIKIYSL